ncbi:MAG: hypothetical protein WCU74_02660 [Candidatus Omnitrophota bacterium]
MGRTWEGVNVRWVLLDEVISIDPGAREAVARARVPAAGASPEVLMIEMMAQTGALLLGAGTDFGRDVVFAKIQDAVFENVPPAGEPLEVRASCENLRPEGAWISASISAQGRGVGSAQLMLMAVGHLIPGREKPVTFHESFMNHYRIREKIR